MNAFDLVGWAGTFLYVYGYLLIALGINTTRRYYFLVNMLGAVGVIVVSVFKGTPQTVVLNLFWLGISIAALASVRPRLPSRARHAVRAAGLVWLAAVAVLFMTVEQSQAVSMLAWFGTAAFLGSYFMFANAAISVSEFIVWNVIAPIALLPRLYDDSNWPVLMLEIFWAATGVYALISRRHNAMTPFRDSRRS